ncbi:MAG: hypothetical protein ACJ79E_11360 [Anaeromyxobacteraceae bacterium]
MSSRTGRVVPALVALLLGCAVVGQYKRDARMRAELDAHEFQRPLLSAWPEVLRLLDDRGYDLVGGDRVTIGLPAQNRVQNLLSKGFDTREVGGGKLALETDQDGKLRRYRVEGTPTAADHCRIVFYVVQAREDGGQDQTRDLPIELALVERLDPDAAERIAAVVLGTGQ